MDVDEALAVVADVKDALHGTRGSRVDRSMFKLAEGIRLARQVAEMSGGPYALEALLDLREWFGMPREVPHAADEAHKEDG